MASEDVIGGESCGGGLQNPQEAVKHVRQAASGGKHRDLNVEQQRAETMTEILQEASKRMQVILFTCRSKAFRHVTGNRITLK